MSCIICWGGNQWGQLGIGSLEEQKVTELRINNFFQDTEIEQIACGGSHTVFVLKTGKIFSCGNNDHGQLGHQKRLSRPEEVDAMKHGEVIQAAAGLSHSLCLTRAGEVFSWGDNTFGQLGRDQVDPEMCKIPKLVKVPHTVVQVSCGKHHNLLLTDDGRLFSWGDNKLGQLGLGHTFQQDAPQLITSIRDVPLSQIACGGSHSFVLSVSGALFGWGKNSFGQLGLSDNLDRSHPTQCKFLRNQQIVYVACGEDHTAALTAHGGLFTYGAGTYGQLGHGTKTHEILPKKVMELMGSNVTQIACGRQHTLAYVFDTGRLYAFGSGANGQLGNSDPSVKAVPTCIPGPFVAYDRKDSATQNQNNPVYVINKIASAADHCFVWATSPQNSKKPVDCKIQDRKFGIKVLNLELIDKISQLSAADLLPVELEDEVTKIFASAACLNASFLLNNDKHFGSSSKNHGVDMQLVKKQFQKIACIQNIVIIQKITQALETSLLPNLPQSPPDVEALRLYLILPMLPMFELPKYYNSLIAPLGDRIRKLDKHASKVLELWWGSFPAEFFLRIVYVYKETVIYLLQLPFTNIPENRTRSEAMYISLEMLKRLNSVNEQNDQIIPYNKFYINELKDNVNLSDQYILWLTQQNANKPGGECLQFCNYPFTFDAAAKSLLLQTDAHLQMQIMTEKANRRNIQSLFIPIDLVNPYLVFYVSRTNIVHDTIQQLLAIKDRTDLKKPLKMLFIGEEAQDEGGVRKEFFMLLLRELLDPKYGMFKYYEESRMAWFSSFTLEDEIMYMLIGSLCGLAIYNSIIIQLSFPLALFKKLLSRPPTVDDLKELMPTVGKSLEQLLAYQNDDIEETFCLTFEILQEGLGETKTIELVAGGSSKHVNKDNRQEFVDLYVDYIFNKSVDVQFRSFHEGFHKVCGGKILELFHPDELRSLVVGNENYDFLELEKYTEYRGDYHRYHQTIQHFWDVFHDLSLADKKKFLLYLTGSDKIPITGMKQVRIVIQPMNVDDNFLPIAHTCFNLLDLPRYSSKETLKTKLLQAIQQTEGFGLV